MLDPLPGAAGAADNLGCSCLRSLYFACLLTHFPMQYNLIAGEHQLRSKHGQ